MNNSLREEQCNIDNYRRYIYTIVREYSTDKDFVDYKNSFNLARSMNQLLEEASEMIENESNPLLATDIYLCVIEEMVNIMKQVDDADGLLESVISTALKLISKISVLSNNWKEELRHDVFYKILKEIENPTYDNREECKICFIESCFKFSDIDELKIVLKFKLEELISNIDDKEVSRNFKERLLIILHDIISLSNSKEEVDEFLYTNIRYPAFREMLIKRAIEYKNYELALRLAFEGEEVDVKKARLVDNWKKLRYLIYKDLGELEEQRKIALELVLNGDYYYYEKLKQIYNKEEWPIIYKNIKSKLSMSKNWRSSQLYIEILLAEDDKIELINYVRRNPKEIEKFAFLLVGENRTEVKDIYKKYILDLADKAKDDKEYKSIVKSIKKYKETFAEEYEELLNMLKSLYETREELINVLNDL